MAEGARIDDASARELITIMRAAARRARNVALNPPGGTAKSRDMARIQATARLRDLERDLRRMNVRAGQIINERVRRTYSKGIKQAEQMMREVGLVRADEPIRGDLMGAEIQRAGVLVRRHQADIDKAFKSIAGVTGRAVRNAQALGLDNAKIRRVLAGGSIDGQPTLTVQRIRKEMQQIAKNGLVEVVNKRTGLVMTFKPDYYADLVYQTAMAEAQVYGEIDRLAAKGHDLVKIIGSNSVHFCTAFVGKVFSLSGTSAVYPAYSSLPRGGPPFHPRCTKRIVPFNERFATPAEKAKALPDDETTKLLGKTPGDAQKAYTEPAKASPAPKPTQPLTPADEPVTVAPATPAPEAGEAIPSPPKPATIPVSDRLQVDSPIPVPKINQGIRAIEKVHRLPPEAKPVPVRWRKLPADKNGEFEAIGRSPVRIDINSQGRHPPATVAHEAGHYVDHQVLATRGSVFGSTASPELAAWRKAVESTQAFKTLKAIKAPTPRGRKYVRYLLDWHEVFARAYAQWIAVRSADAAMVEMMTKAELVVVGQQWELADFAPVAEALDEVFRKRGLLNG